MIEIEWVQHPVGHGGFHVGRAVTNDTAVPFTWVFDCGSRRSAKLNVYLQSWCRSHPFPIDWLFISHFDKDHVSGLEELMSRTATANVMAPYVNPGELAISLLEEIRRDRLDRWFVDLAADPAAWLLGRGAGRVIFLRGGGDVGPREPPFGLEPPLDGGEGDGWRTTIMPPPRPIAVPRIKGRVGLHARAAVVDSPCEVSVLTLHHGVRLRPYCEAVPAATHKQLLKELIKLIGASVGPTSRPGLGSLAYAIAAHARSESGRAGLRRVYSMHIGSSNRSSLSLLSAPSRAVNAGRTFYVVSPRRNQQIIGLRQLPAWVNTGDAELLPSAALAAWEAHYLADLPQVEILALPHHGSDHNSDAAFQQLAPKALLTAHTKTGGRNHPGSGVAAAAGSRLAPVTSNPASAVCMWYREY